MGTAPAEWMPLRAPEYYAERKIELLLDSRVQSLDARSSAVYASRAGGESISTRCCSRPGPIRCGWTFRARGSARLFYLRTFADSQAIVAAAATAQRVVVVGASFIGLEVAASLRHRGIEVHVVGPERIPFEHVLGAQLGAFLRELHESARGRVSLGHFGRRRRRHGASRSRMPPSSRRILWSSASACVPPSSSPSRRDWRSIAAFESTSTSRPVQPASSQPAISRAGPIRHSGDRIRVEHWVVAERQGQAAALNILGRRQRFDAVPFFWSQHYDLTINYVGHAESWDAIEIEGSLNSRDCAVTYRRGGRILAVASIGSRS